MSQGSLPLGGTASRNKLGVAEQLWKRLMEMCCARWVYLRGRCIVKSCWRCKLPGWMGW